MVQERPLGAAQESRAAQRPPTARTAHVQQTNKRLYRAYLLKEQLRALYQLPDPTPAPEHLRAWLAWAARSQLRPFVRLARALRACHAGILAAIRLGLTNSRLEGLHSTVRLLSHRSFGFHSPAPLTALHYLCAAGIPSDVRFVSDPVAWTEVPESLRVLGRQRDRWHRGLADVL